MAFPETPGAMTAYGKKVSDKMSLPHVDGGAQFVVLDANLIETSSPKTSVDAVMDGFKAYINSKTPETFIMTASSGAQERGGGPGNDPEFV